MGKALLLLLIMVCALVAAVHAGTMTYIDDGDPVYNSGLIDLNGTGRPASGSNYNGTADLTVWGDTNIPTARNADRVSAFVRNDVGLDNSSDWHITMDVTNDLVSQDVAFNLLLMDTLPDQTMFNTSYPFIYGKSTFHFMLGDQFPNDNVRGGFQLKLLDPDGINQYTLTSPRLDPIPNSTALRQGHNYITVKWFAAQQKYVWKYENANGSYRIDVPASALKLNPAVTYFAAGNINNVWQQACGWTIHSLEFGPGAEPEPVPSIDVLNEPQLFLDDYVIESTDQVERVLHQPVRHGLVKNWDGSDLSTDEWAAEVYLGNIVCRDSEGKFHMTYLYMWGDPSIEALVGDDKAHWFRQSTAYAWSDDGLHWHKPILGLEDGPSGFMQSGIPDFPFYVASGMSKDNNIGCPMDFVYDLHEHGNIQDPDKRFLVRTVRKSGTDPFAQVLEQQLYYASDWPDFANDPEWKEKMSPIAGDISPRRFNTMVGYDHDAGVWFSTHQDELYNWRPRGGRDIARYYSPDLVNWYGPTLVLPIAADESKELTDYVEYMNMEAYRVGGQSTGAWLGQLQIFHGDRSNIQYAMPGTTDVWRKGYTELRLMTSRDAGITWNRVCDKQVWLPNNPDPDGLEHIVYQHAPIKVGDELWMYYGSWNGDHLAFNRDGTVYDYRVARTAFATLRWDGYVSLEANTSEGTVVTKPLRYQGNELHLNADCSGGTIIVEILDSFGNPISGYTAADCIPVSGNSVDQMLTWAGRPRLEGIPTEGISLKFYLNGGKLYSFQFREPFSEVQGLITLRDWTGVTQGMPATIELRDGTGATLETKNVILNSGGIYSFTTALTGEYIAVAKVGHWLARALPISIQAGRGSLNFALINGDCNGDNGVDELDYSLLSNAWYQAEGNPRYNAQADLNGDGAVDEIDYAILSNAWYTAGD